MQSEKMKFEHSGTLDKKVSLREKNHNELARELATEGIVLLKNEGILPLEENTRIALLGKGASKTVKGGIGSGDVNNRRNVSIFEGLRDKSVIITSKKWIADYEEKYNQARLLWKEKIYEDVKKFDNPFDAYAVNPFVFPEGELVNQEDLGDASVAIYVISRISGEGKDRSKIKGDYFLSENERKDIKTICKSIPVILLINAGGPVELTDILEEEDNIKAVLNISQLGQAGGNAVADILMGDVVPSGKLTTTWAKKYEDYPYSEEFAALNGNLETEYYKEGIYVGYRYFESFNVKPLFEFGYGLSYTSFEHTYKGIKIEEGKIILSAFVKNVGDKYVGKDVLQVYASLPKGEIDKESVRLLGFEKTQELHPFESQLVQVVIPQKMLASFSEKENAWVIEAGEYPVFVGSSVEDKTPIVILDVKESKIIERVNKICPMQVEFCDIKSETVSAVVCDNRMEFVPVEEPKYKNKITPETEIPVEELIPALYGNVTDNTSNLGSAGVRVPGSAGETTEKLEEKYGLKSLIMADGPAGIRLRQSYEVDRATDAVYGVGVLGSLENGYLEPMEYHDGAELYFQYCTAFPVGTAIAQTWNRQLLEKFGEAIAVEMREFHVNLWLAPGMNIHRNPLCGRNFEYFSEDPLVAGSVASAITKGVQSRPGCGVTIKHFACNNQEDNRMGVDACVSERALREIYFRGFEIAVKESKPVSVMTSYNLINGIHAANNKDLCTTVLRDEWGFDGVVMSDWNTTVPEDGSVAWKCAAAGNDIIMPGNPDDERNIREAYERGDLGESDIRECAGRIISLIRKMM